MVKRPGLRFARRSPILERRRNRRDLDPDALAAWRSDDRLGSSRPGLHALRKSQTGQLHQMLTRACPPQDAIKVVESELDNIGQRTRHLSATYFAEWVLGTHRENAANAGCLQTRCRHREPLWQRICGQTISPENWPLSPPAPLRIRPLPTGRSFSANMGPSSTPQG